MMPARSLETERLFLVAMTVSFQGVVLGFCEQVSISMLWYVSVCCLTFAEIA
jgi:hypothetical protein